MGHLLRQCAAYLCFGRTQPGILGTHLYPAIVGDALSRHRQGEEHGIPVPNGTVQGHRYAVYRLALADDSADTGQQLFGGLRFRRVFRYLPEPVGELACRHGVAAGGEHQHGGNDRGQSAVLPATGQGEADALFDAGLGDLIQSRDIGLQVIGQCIPLVHRGTSFCSSFRIR